MLPSCCSLLPPCDTAQAALSSLEREAKENVYAVLDPHIQYEITINKHGEPPKYLSLSKPLIHQRTHAFEPDNVPTKELNNNNYERFSTFKTGPPKIRRSKDKKSAERNYICKTNNDIQYSKDPLFGKIRSTDTNQYAQKYNEHRDSKNYSRMYERNNNNTSGKREIDTKRNQDGNDGDFQNPKRSSNLNWNDTKETEKGTEEFAEETVSHDKEEDFKPRPGKVRELALRFNKCSSGNIQSFSSKQRPKPLQSYGNQAYLDHVFPDAVEI